MKILSFFGGLLLIGSIVYAGYYTTNHLSFVIWFGVITAILAPLAFELIFFPFKYKEKSLIKDLSKVPKIELLIKEAKDSESKVRLLEEQRKDLDKLISYESHRKTLIAEKEIYSFQAKIALENLVKIDKSLETLTSEKQELPEHLQLLQKRIEQTGDNEVIFLFNDRNIILKKSNFEILPFYGTLIFEILKLITNITNNEKK